MHIRVILRQIGLGRTKAYYLIEDCYFALYFIGRIIIGTVMLWYIMTCDKISPLMKVVGFPLEIRSLYYVKLIYRLVISRKLFKIAIAEEGIELQWFTPPTYEQLERCAEI